MPELLSPAGNFEKLRAALLYGADAVYLAGNMFGMRSAADNFTDEELYAAADYVHSRGKKIFLTLNTLPRTEEYSRLEAYIKSISAAGFDAFIVADLGVMTLLREIIPDAEIHISTQASIISAAAANAYIRLGAKRLVLARELTISEIAEIRKAIPPEIELEAFIHGSMCVSYSGRCILSNYIVGKDANRGACTQPCRWNYSFTEEKRPDIHFPIEENANGTFIMSSKDMCTIELIPELIKCGIDSFKIEGRMKSAYYAAVVTNAYRMAIDSYLKEGDNYRFNPKLLYELDSVSHREYCTGFFLDSPLKNANLGTMTGYIREKAYFAVALEYNIEDLPTGFDYETEDGRLYKFQQKNKVMLDDSAQIISPSEFGKSFRVNELYDEDGNSLESAPHPSMFFYTRVPFEVKSGDIMRSAETNEVLN